MAKDSIFGADTLEFIAQLQAVYGSDPRATDSHLLSDYQESIRPRSNG